MATVQILRNELDADPLSRGYAGMTSQQKADDLNTVYRERDRTSVTGDELFSATVPAEFNALSNGSITAGTSQGNAQLAWVSFCARDQIDPFATANVEFVKFIFGAGSATVAALTAVRKESVSRAQELGFGEPIGIGLIANAEAL